jgi:CheY-like chemotaxis protein
MATLLLIEDNDMNRDMLARRLTRRGYTVVQAIDGHQGIDMARTIQPDLILMDLSLPVLDGWEATRQLRARSETATIPIIALTAHALTGERERSLEAGCNDYETKPIDFARLLDKIARLLPHNAAS